MLYIGKYMMNWYMCYSRIYCILYYIIIYIYMISSQTNCCRHNFRKHQFRSSDVCFCMKTAFSFFRKKNTVFQQVPSLKTYILASGNGWLRDVFPLERLSLFRGHVPFVFPEIVYSQAFGAWTALGCAETPGGKRNLGWGHFGKCIEMPTLRFWSHDLWVYPWVYPVKKRAQGIPKKQCVYYIPLIKVFFSERLDGQDSDPCW